MSQLFSVDELESRKTCENLNSIKRLLEVCFGFWKRIFLDFDLVIKWFVTGSGWQHRTLVRECGQGRGISNISLDDDLRASQKNGAMRKVHVRMGGR